MKAPKLTEAQLHRQVADYLAAALPSTAVFTTFPAGGGGKVRGAQLKARGLRAGWPDVQVIHAGRFVGIELKADKGVISPEQIECHRLIFQAGGRVFICRSLDEIEDRLRGFGIPLKATTMPGGGWRAAA